MTPKEKQKIMIVTKNHIAVLGFIELFLNKNNYGPTVIEISTSLNIKWRSIYRIIHDLQNHNYLKWEKNRSGFLILKTFQKK